MEITSVHSGGLPAPGHLLVSEETNLAKISGGFLALPDSVTATCERHQGLKQRR